MTLALTTPTGAQILHQGNAVLATEVHKLNVLHLGVKVHTFALRIVAALSRVEQGDKVVRYGLRAVGEAVCPHRAGRQLQETWRGVGPLPDEPQDQRVVTETQLPQVRKPYQALGQGLELVLVELQGYQLGHQGEVLG